MNKKQITAKLRDILNREDVESDGLVNRKQSSLHESEVEVLLENLSILVLDLRFDAEASRRELFDVRSLLEEGNTN